MANVPTTVAPFKVTAVAFRSLSNPTSSLKAFASVTFETGMTIDGFGIVRGEGKPAFARVPQNSSPMKNADGTPVLRDGKPVVRYFDSVKFPNDIVKQAVTDQVIAKYNELLKTAGQQA